MFSSLFYAWSIWHWESGFCLRNKQFCGRMGKGGGGGSKASTRILEHPPSFPTAPQPASRWWDQITHCSPAQPLPQRGCKRQCNPGHLFFNNQAVLGGWALIRPSIGSFWEQPTNQILYGSLSPPPPWQLDNSPSWWNFLPQDIPAAELLHPFKTRVSRVQKLKQLSGLISVVCPCCWDLRLCFLCVNMITC